MLRNWDEVGTSNFSKTRNPRQELLERWQTTARSGRCLRGSQFLLASLFKNGQYGKLGGSWRPAAETLLVSVRTAGNEGDSAGISVLLIPANSPGIVRRDYTTVDGHRAAQFRFENVQVPVSAMLGAPHAALPALQQVIDRATLCVCAEAAGAMDTLLHKTVEYSKTRRQFDVPIGSFQALQHRMADMFIECELARSIVMMAAMTLDSDVPEPQKQRAVSAAKSRVGRAARKVGQEAVQLHGGIGITDELDVSHYFKRLTAIELLFGNTDFHTARFARLQG